MKLFLAYRFTGEDPKELEKEIRQLGNAIKNVGHDYTCSFELEDFFHSNQYTPGMIQKYMMELQEKHDAVLAYIKSSSRSEGMLMEAGQAIANKQPLIVAVKKGVYSLMAQPEIAKKVIEFETLDELCEKIKLGHSCINARTKT